MKLALFALVFSLSAIAAEPAKAEIPKAPEISDKQKVRIWKAVAVVREIELRQRELLAQREKADAEVKAAIADVQKAGYVLDGDLNLIAEPKEVKK